MAAPINPHSTGTKDLQINTELIEAIGPAPELRTAYDQLRPMERKFVDAYLSNDSPLLAIRSVFPIPEGMTLDKWRTTTTVRAWDFIRRPLIQAAIAEKMRVHAEKWDLTTERVLAEVAKIAYSNMDDYIDRSTGEPILMLDPAKVTRDQMAAVSEFRIETTVDKEGNKTTKTTFKLHDKLSALDKAMKKLGLLGTGSPTVNILAGSVKTVNDREVVTIDMTDEQAAEQYARSLEQG